jgi:peptidoglycan/xylan/chitin deacetylase (PgdA/CDA1 family)
LQETSKPAAGRVDLTRRIENTVDTLLGRSFVQPLFRWRTSKSLLVLAYHGLTDRERFASQLEFLQSTMNPVSLDEVLDALKRREGLPPRSVLLTFDDGDRSIYDTALPVMSSCGFPGVVFVVAGLIGTQEPFWWQVVDELVGRGGFAPGLVRGDPAASVAALKRVPDQARRAAIEALKSSTPGPAVTGAQLRPSELVELEAGGIAVGGHTFSHPCLDRCTDDEVAYEIEQGHARTTELLGHAPRAFAYPNGNYDSRAAATLQRLGYEASFLFDHRISPFPPSDPMAISRIRVSSSATPDRFRILVSGLHSSMHHLMGRP